MDRRRSGAHASAKLAQNRTEGARLAEKARTNKVQTKKAQTTKAETKKAETKKARR
jgi:hypothetical protein